MTNFGRFWLVIISFIFLAGMNGDSARNITQVDHGNAILEFNGSTTAATQVDYNVTFTTPPTMVCTATVVDSGEHTTIGCQSLTSVLGSIRAEVDFPRENPLTVNWVAVGE